MKDVLTPFLLTLALVSCADTLSSPLGAQSQSEVPVGVSSGAATAGGLTRNYQLYVPATNNNRPRPLVVMLHGCTQSPQSFAAGTRMNTLADQEGFLVVYPEQSASANASRCWNWFEPAHQARNTGEPAVIKAMVDKVRSQVAVDSKQVYVAGLSAGGAMSVIMGATYPDVFAAIGVSAGLEYQAATDLTGALAAMRLGGPDPDAQGKMAYSASEGIRRRVAAIVFHGSNDLTVAPVNGTQVAAQWVQTNDLADDGIENDSVSEDQKVTSAGSVPGGRSYTVETYAQGLVEHWNIAGMSHAWSGGSREGSYTDPTGPDASAVMWRFFNAAFR
ncbi:PHB depolymerase family esterase [Deinococcus deserti]|uniref:Putative esterase n=1 Tax=Deinococcus deserti (strain DSM 17065 / CIP 109153 / LMG 22923 / VCD115) TaxID=546414 RepID=C1D2G3_DEIDV|nr:PHB depolymerase family esterase [Deinococcus deserti]ACO47602.2 putative esterase [Deinococcus deserti VCD115]